VEWLSVSAAGPEPAVLARAAAILRAGGLVVFPTDTLYGLAADPRHSSGVARVFSVKGRPAGQALPLVAADLDQAQREVAVMSADALRLARRFWPGPLTLVADARPGLAAGVAGEDGTVALRVPDHEVARGLAAALGFAVISTSANPSGGVAPGDARTAAALLEGPVDAVLDAGPTRGGLPSTIVDARVRPLRLLRPGAVPIELIYDSMSRP
jgi:L-threonylcarbamoyladenylate synthase